MHMTIMHVSLDFLGFVPIDIEITIRPVLYIHQKSIRLACHWRVYPCRGLGI